MDADGLAVIGALVQQQNQNLLRVQPAVDRRRRERKGKRDFIRTSIKAIRSAQ
jgi:hypothetical protein